MKKLFASVLSIVLVFSSSVFAAYTPTDADADIKEQVRPNIETLVSTDINRLVGIANKIAMMLPEFDSNGRVYHILEWVYDTIVVSVDAERARRAEMATHSDTMDDMEEEEMAEEMDDIDEEMEEEGSDMMSGDDTMDDTTDDMSETHVFDITSEPYLFSQEEIVVNV